MNKFPDSIELSGIVANLEILIGTVDATAALDDYQSLGPDAAERISKDLLDESIERAISAENVRGEIENTAMKLPVQGFMQRLAFEAGALLDTPSEHMAILHDNIPKSRLDLLRSLAKTISLYRRVTGPLAGRLRR